MILWNLFLAFLRIGSFAIGGAYSFLPLIEREVVQKYHWLTRNEFMEVLGIVKIFPGAISIKYATYTGYKMAGVPGAIVANLGNLLAPALLIIFASVLYAKYKDLPSVKGAFNMIQLVVFAMILAVALKLVDINQLLHLKSMLVVIVSFILFAFTNIHPAFIIVGAGILGIFLT
jgi:chromate transporter